MNTKIFLSLSVAILVVMCFSAFASATEINIQNLSSTNLNLTHGSSITSNFNVQNAHLTNSYTLTLSSTNSWVSGLPSPFVVANNATSDAKSFLISIPLYTLAGDYTIPLIASNGTITDTQNYLVHVPSSPAFTLTRNTDILSRAGNGTFTVTNTGNTPLNLALSSSGSYSADFYDGTTKITSLTLGIQGTKQIRVVPVNIPSTLNFGDNSLTVSANDSVNSVSQAISFTIQEGFCKPAVGTNFSLSNIEITNDGKGDDNEWFLLDNVRVRVDVDNLGPNDLRNTAVEFGLFDSSGKNVANKLTFTSKGEDKYTLGTVKSGDNKRATFELKVPGDLKTGTYKLVFKTYSKDVSQANLCADSLSAVESISISNQDDSGKYIAFDDSKLTPTEATCGDFVNLDVNVFNVGENNEDQVKVTLYNKDLGVNQFYEIKEGLDMGDSKALSFAFQIPTGLADKSYNLELGAYYDYNNGDYDQSLDSTTLVPLKVFGCSPVQPNSGIASITAELQSDAKPNEDVLVSATIKNTGLSSAQFTVDLTGYSDWAKLNSISERLITLGAGESKAVQISMLPNADVSGDKSFTFNVHSGDKSQTKQIVVAFPAKTSDFWNSLKNNQLAWIIGLVNVILIILIIVVAVKLSKN